MRLTKIAVAVATLIGMSTAYAGHNEQFWQADEGANAFTAEMKYMNNDSKTKVGGIEANTSGKKFAFEYERGLSQAYSLGATLTYVMSHTTDADAYLDNLDLFMKGHMDEAFHWGVNLEANTGDKDKGAYDAMKYGFYLGYDFTNGWGARLDYLMAAETEAKVTASTYTNLTGYYEHDMAGAHWGYSATYSMASKSKDASGDVDDSADFLVLKAYPTWELGTGTLLTGLSYGTLMGGKIKDSFDSVSALGVEVGYRMAF